MDKQRYIIFLFTLFGGYCDASTFVLAGVFCSHITGNSVLAMVYMVEGNWIMFVYCSVSLSGFLFGTVLGCLWRLYCLTDRYFLIMSLLFIQTVLVITGGVLWMASNSSGFIVCQGLSMGLQNGVIMYLHNIKIHSTYISGMSTTLLNSLFKKHNQEELELHRTLFADVFCFITGALFGGMLTYYFSVTGMFFSLSFLLIAGIINYRFYCAGYI
ncbi:TPA: DUF1275 domain-containing protein [Escherichia coli]|nr:DUF1275 domain-containing protein [Escherichia coli]